MGRSSAHTDGFADEPTYVAIFSLFAAIIGSISFWGSNIAFAKLQEILPGPADHDRRARSSSSTSRCSPIAVGVRASRSSPAADDELLMIVLLLAAAVARQPASCCRSAAPTCRS